MEFKIAGIVREKESKRPIPGLLVRAFDKDLFFSDLLGNVVTSSSGFFAIGYEGKDFNELFDKRPDIYLDIYGSATAQDPGRAGDSPIYTTKNFVRFNAGQREFFLIEIPRSQLGEDAPGPVTISPPEGGEGQESIDDFTSDNPVDWNPNNECARPSLFCDFVRNAAAPLSLGPIEETGIQTGFAEIITFEGPLIPSRLVTIRVTNRGHAVSFNSYVALYEGPMGYTHPLQDYRLCSSKMMTINPGQAIDVEFNWTPFRKKGRVVGVCYDPFLDPRGFNIVKRDHEHKHIASQNYNYDESFLLHVGMGSVNPLLGGGVSDA